MQELNKVYTAWETVNIDDKMFFLINESAKLIWSLRKAGDQSRLEDFRGRLSSDLKFADDELRELELRNKIKALLEADIDKDTAAELSVLSDEIRGYLDCEAHKSA